MRLKLFLLCFAVCLSVPMFLGCGDDNSTSSNTNTFAGNWNIVFAGDFVGGGSISIGSNGQFSANVVLQDASGSFTNTIDGTVTNSGVVTNGRILQGGSQIGTITGNFSGRQRVMANQPRYFWYLVMRPPPTARSASLPRPPAMWSCRAGATTRAGTWSDWIASSTTSRAWGSQP